MSNANRSARLNDLALQGVRVAYQTDLAPRRPLATGSVTMELKSVVTEAAMLRLRGFYAPWRPDLSEPPKAKRPHGAGALSSDLRLQRLASSQATRGMSERVIPISANSRSPS